MVTSVQFWVIQSHWRQIYTGILSPLTPWRISPEVQELLCYPSPCSSGRSSGFWKQTTVHADGACNWHYSLYSLNVSQLFQENGSGERLVLCRLRSHDRQRIECATKSKPQDRYILLKKWFGEYSFYYRPKVDFPPHEFALPSYNYYFFKV